MTRDRIEGSGIQPLKAGFCGIRTRALVDGNDLEASFVHGKRQCHVVHGITAKPRTSRDLAMDATLFHVGHKGRKPAGLSGPASCEQDQAKQRKQVSQSHKGHEVLGEG